MDALLENRLPMHRWVGVGTLPDSFVFRPTMHGYTGASIINPAVLAQADRLRAGFAAAEPFPHVSIDGFFEPAFARELLDGFPGFEQGNFIGDDGQPGGKSTSDRVRALGPAYRRLDDAIQSPDFLGALTRITGIEGLIYDPWYLGGGTHENRNGMSLDPHVDFNFHPSERWHRRLNLIVYLNPVWSPEWGGCFELFRDPHASANPDVTIAPTFNQCAIFATSERSWHGFDRIRLPGDRAGLTRRSIALYFYTKDRSADETAERHTTYYVKRQLPERIVEGRVLDADDVDELRDLMAQRDAHIRMLYAENTALRKAQETGVAGQLLYLAKRAYVRFRR